MAPQAADTGGASPVAPGHRIESIDALRGLALFGVLAINLETEFRVSIFQQFLPGPPRAGIERAVDAFLAIFLDLKALAVFSLLFGIGLAIQYDRLAGHRRRPVLLVRRMLALLAFGLVHLFLIWDGDILTEYALAGLVVLPFLFGPTWAVALGAALSLLFYLAMPALPPLVAFPDVSWLTSHVQAATRVYGTGGFADVLAFRIDEVKAMLTLHVLIFPRTVGLFLLGMLAWRLGIARDAGRHARGLWLAGATGVAIGLVLIVTIGASPYALWPARGAVGAIAASAGTIVLALGYATLVAAAGTGSAGRWLTWAEPVGRMAFTNYVVQSLVLGWIFYGYGLGLFARIGLVEGLGLVVAIYVGQVLFSRWWLRRFRYGPLEWLWRTLTYGARLPFRWPVPARHLAGSPPQF